jgi:hypothetical protein
MQLLHYKGKRYHCSIISESEWLIRHEGERYTHYDLTTLCGLAVTGRSWDFPAEWASNADSYSGFPKCKKCLNSPKLPLLVLGEL